ncbi:DNA polymerase IV [Helcococcus sueciensis]|uniref:DNA polymerase IV n=1 Tax=Helcococcus sueciensis TaxID=241555 RepID=UPI000416D8E9|nr:DNA polymerase IV [Helcococcus sueciensis]
MDRDILHIDMNNCFASIEIKLNPSLKGLPVVVSRSDGENSGIVLAKSQEAKKFGIKTAETIWQARKKCKDIVIVPPHYDEYKKHSIWAREIYYSYTNQVEPFGLDEAWLDVTGSKRLFGTAENIAHELRNRIKNELGITVSVGVSFNKIFAKLGSDMKKPDAVTVINKENFKDKVWPLNVDAMIGIGESTRKKLNDNGIFTLGDLAESNEEDIEKLIGVSGEKIWIQANGLDNTPVRDFYTREDIKSIGHGNTFSKNLETFEEVRNEFQKLAIMIGDRLIENNLEAMGIQIRVRDNQMKTHSFQETLEYSTFSSIVIRDRAIKLFNNYKWINPIRFLEIRAINLTKESNIQTNLFETFDDAIKKSKVDKAIFDIKSQFGEIITFGSLNKKDEIEEDKDIDN